MSCSHGLDVQQQRKIFFAPLGPWGGAKRVFTVSVRPSVRPSITLSPPKPLDELPTRMACSTAQFFEPHPLGPWGAKKVKYHLISITKSISKIFKPNIVCLFTNERYKAFETWFHPVAWVIPQGWGCGGGGG